MADEFVKREEFDLFRNETNHKIDELNNDIKEFSGLLSKIDKKTDIMLNTIENNKDTESLKIESAIAPLVNKQDLQEHEIKENTKDITEIKENNKWLWRTVVASIIAMIGEIIVAAIAFFK
jgi:DNA-binding XRE family transcriptional regulator